MAIQDVKQSRAEIAALESAFANDPSSDAYQPLAEAYLAAGRFMEAMVVCKKGVKAHPGDPEARVLMGRIYADQSKDRRAADEFRSALEINPDHVEANRLLGTMLLTQGEIEEGTIFIQKAASIAPEDRLVREVCKKWCIKPPTVPVTPKVEEQKEAESPPSGIQAGDNSFQGASAGMPQGAVSPPQHQAPHPQQTAQQPQHIQQGAQVGQPASGTSSAFPEFVPGSVSARGNFQSPAQGYEQSRIEPDQYQSDLFPDDLDAEFVPFTRTKKAYVSAVMLIAGTLFTFVWWGVQHTSASRTYAADELLTQAQTLLGKGSYINYLKAGELAQEALGYRRSGEHGVSANAYLAYVNVLRWGEHLEGEAYRAAAQRHLREIEQSGETLAYRVAAQAMFDFFDGNTQEAIDFLREWADREGTTSGVIFSTLGHMYLWSGELDYASTYLGRAQQLSAADPRVFVALGELQRKRDNARRADYYYAHAIRLDPEHVEALLGQALIILDTPWLNNERAGPYIDRILRIPSTELSPRQTALARFARAQLLYAQNKPEEAKSQEEQALLAQPENPDLHVMIGRRLFRENEYSEAAESIRRAIHFEPNRAGFHLELARVLMGSPGREGAREAVQALERARQAFPDNPQLLLMLGEAHDAANNPDGALAAYRLANEKSGGNMPEAFLGKGVVLRKRGDHNAANAQLDKAETAYRQRGNNRGRAQAIVEKARVQIDQNNRRAARDILIQALEIDAEYPDAYFFFGEVMSRPRRTRGNAREALRHYLTLDPSGEYAERAKELLRSL